MLNTAKSILNCFRSLENTLLETPKIISVQQKRTTYILKRKYPPGFCKKGYTNTEKLKHRHFIYEVVQRPNQVPIKPIDIILTEYVAGLGEKGDRMTLKHSFAYKKLLLPGLAVYSSPENIAKYVVDKGDVKKQFSSPYVENTIKFLSVLLVRVEMNVQTPWTIERWHIKSALRRCGVHCPEDAITLPERKISGPNLEMQDKEFYATVTINNTENVKIRCRLHHVHINSTMAPALDPDYAKYPQTAIFPEDQEILDSMPRHNSCKEIKFEQITIED